MKDSFVEVPDWSANDATRTAKPTETIAVPRNFCDFDRPSERRRRTFM